MPFPIMIDHVSKIYHSRHQSIYALDDLSLTISPGIFGLLGRNGAGKTTLLSLLATITEVSQGTITVGTLDSVRNRWPIRRMLGYMPQDQGFYPTLTVQETLEYLASLSHLAAISVAITRVLHAVNLSDKVHARVSTLSGGMRRRLALAQALLHDPQILIIDEPTAGLDPVEQQRFRALIGGLGAQTERTIILSTHSVEDIAYTANSLAVLEQGKLLYSGSTRSLIMQATASAWEWTTSLDELQQVQAKIPLIVTSLIPVPGENEQVIVRIAGSQPHADAQQRPPTLEDAYFALLQQPSSPSSEDVHR